MTKRGKPFHICQFQCILRQGHINGQSLGFKIKTHRCSTSPPSQIDTMVLMAMTGESGGVLYTSVTVRYNKVSHIRIENICYFQ